MILLLFPFLMQTTILTSEKYSSLQDLEKIKEKEKEMEMEMEIEVRVEMKMELEMMCSSVEWLFLFI